MYIYEITFLGGNKLKVRANSPKEAQEYYSKLYDNEVIRVKWIR